MRTMILAALLTALSALAAGAQEGLATTSTIGGHNTIQQAPSGGAERPTVVGPGVAGNSGQPTPAERKDERHNDAVTSICKGC